MEAHRNPAAADAERHAYNLAFCELGLDWFWDAKTFGELQHQHADERVQRYVATHQPHLLRAYDAGFLAQAVESTHTRAARLAT